MVVKLFTQYARGFVILSVAFERPIGWPGDECVHIRVERSASAGVCRDPGAAVSDRSAGALTV